jgi:DNA-binding transcriptional ArsR family regulator
MNKLITARDADELEKVFKALGHRTRLQIVFGLLDKECNVKNMTECLHTAQASVSQQLAVLRAAGVVECSRRGNQVCYRVVKPWIRKLVRTVVRSLQEEHRDG